MNENKSEVSVLIYDSIFHITVSNIQLCINILLNILHES